MMYRPEDIPDGMKWCYSCQEILSISWFGPHARSKDGHRYVCICCEEAYMYIADEEGRYKGGTVPLPAEIRRMAESDVHEADNPRLREYRKKYRRLHRAKMVPYFKMYRDKNKDRINKKNQEQRDQAREEGIKLLGGKCACCGESRHEFLTIDHINGRKRRHPSRNDCGKKLFLQLKREGWPLDGLQLLCWNCNSAKGMYGSCPHTW